MGGGGKLWINFFYLLLHDLLLINMEHLKNFSYKTFCLVLM